MELRTVLAGLDAHPWAAVNHAYGPAEDLPGLLRALAEDGADAEEALDELYGSIVHQGTVYAASADAAPYLARIAASGRRSLDALRLLGCLAESEDEYEVAPGAVRAAVAAQLPLLLPLLADQDAAVRQAAGWTVGHTRDAGPALPAVRARLAVETEPVVRAELLTAYGRLDRAGAAAEARALLGPGTPAPLRLAAVFAALDAGEPWRAAHHDAVLGLLPAAGTAGSGHTYEHREPLRAIVGALLERDTEADRESALALLDAALHDERPEARAEALWAADLACARSRSAPRRLIPALVPLAADATAARLLGKLGPAAAEAAPVLAALAEPAVRADDESDDEAADRALAALVLVAPQAAAPLLARALGRRPRALQCAAGSHAPADAPFPFDPELFAAVRARLAARTPERPEPCGCPPTGDQGDTAGLVHLLRQWGPQAVEALPELCAVLPQFPYAATAITAVTGGVVGTAVAADAAAGNVVDVAVTADVAVGADAAVAVGVVGTAAAVAAGAAAGGVVNIAVGADVTATAITAVTGGVVGTAVAADAAAGDVVDVAVTADVAVGADAAVAVGVVDIAAAVAAGAAAGGVVDVAVRTDAPVTAFGAGTTVAIAAGPQWREQAATALRAGAGKLLVAQALYVLTGETGPLFTAVEAALAGGARGVAEGARAAAALGPAAGPLVPALRAALGRAVDRDTARDTTPEVDADLALALALWRITGEAAEAVAVLDAVFDRCEGRRWFHWTAARAAREIAVLGPAGRPLTARLHALLDHPAQAPSAVLGLLAVADPADLDRARLAEAALHSAETRADLDTACDALRALGPAVLTPRQRDRLAALATGDRRLPVFGAEDAVIREDEQLRTVLASLLDRLG
ncbi:hypothetical protein [Kitasatospora sp. NPDC088783]|uniref:hypothetical protein n=1 Tax=Kitasatospora sp. NPDC088783 TaxID=3364077 RepID=UPI0038027539